MNQSDPAGFLTGELEEDRKEQLGDLRPAAQALAAWQVPEPSAEEQAAFVQALSVELPQRIQPRFGIKGWVNLMRAQVRLFEVEFWYACAAIVVFLLVGGLLVGGGGLALLTIMGSPLIAMAGVLYVFHRDSSGLAALEAASPVGRLALFYCRSGLILGLNLAALPFLLIPGQLLFPELVFWRVALIWLGALVGLFGLATYATVRWNGIMGSVLPLGIWGLLVVFAWQQAFAHVGNWLMAPVWLAQVISASNGLLWTAALAVLGGAWLFFSAGRWVKKDHGAWA